MADPPEVTILLLGDAECGKSTFLSYVTPFFALNPCSSSEMSTTAAGLKSLFSY
jgi:DNA replicative helicase MCM subunit Mcm2 (Cdc46/Mcm family)